MSVLVNKNKAMNGGKICDFFLPRKWIYMQYNFCELLCTMFFGEFSLYLILWRNFSIKRFSFVSLKFKARISTNRTKIPTALLQTLFR
jgi:hypothetical protein